jgi:Polysaccharide biosynthesis enzyme WcbI
MQDDSKKKIVICMNCHGIYIKNLLESVDEIKNKYLIERVNYVYYIDNKNETDFTENDKNILKNLDILIVQYIKNDRGHINHSEVIKKYTNEKTKFVIIPHYTFYGYFSTYDMISEIDNDIKNSNNIPMCIENFDVKKINYYINKKIKNVLTKDGILHMFNSSLDKVKQLDNFSDVKLFEFIKNNYKSIKLFENPSHPRNIVFVEIVEQILKKIDINYSNLKKNNISYHSNQIYPIFNEIKETLNLEFDTNMYYNDKEYISIYEYYYLLIILKYNLYEKFDMDKNIKNISMIGGNISSLLKKIREFYNQ